MSQSSDPTPSAGRTPLSVAIITRNEAKNLPACLESVRFAGQVVIVDSGSTDDTLAIARSYGCDIHQTEWRGFGPQKQYAIDRCSYPWVLILDADERIPEETADRIQKIVTATKPDAEGYRFRRKNIFKDRWIRHLGWWPDTVLRLFRKEAGRMTDATVHEAVIVSGLTRNLDATILHMTESDLSRIIDKINRYSSLGAHDAFCQGKQSSIAGAFFRATFTFLHNYFLRGGMFDGSQGLILSMTDAVNKFFKYAKLCELQTGQNKIANHSINTAGVSRGEEDQ